MKTMDIINVPFLSDPPYRKPTATKAKQTLLAATPMIIVLSRPTRLINTAAIGPQNMSDIEPTADKIKAVRLLDRLIA